MDIDNNIIILLLIIIIMFVIVIGQEHPRDTDFPISRETLRSVRGQEQGTQRCSWPAKTVRRPRAQGAQIANAARDPV